MCKIEHSLQKLEIVPTQPGTIGEKSMIFFSPLSGNLASQAIAGSRPTMVNEYHQ